MQQARDFLDESEALFAVLSPLDEDAFDTVTLFKGWTFNNILRHLHVWNIAADLSLTDNAAFGAMLRNLMGSVKDGRFTEAEEVYLKGLSGQELLATWIKTARDTTQHFILADPKLRLKWVGPDMSALSSISARLMESWSHAQAIYDALALVRVDDDRIGNIARLGVNTYTWTFKNRKEDVPHPMPYIRLTAPSGTIWEYGEASQTEIIEGSATQFCQVVTQTRNVADTSLRVTGVNASRWMAIAQCFAGPPNDPPVKGMRRIAA
jgi:uncharacterized protein (TIGR03084 family)